ncbi:ROK family transcriptional regulator [Saccharothrix obliqua]|uniref:ROK family transcriptional regulator n=1 Tax=Saccharothrix obliqua TaxID=2861747 RepID=UPI001C60699F|nr:ROK family transcriptional regulator [Saccharothrix obliqua]MBW4722197.1 ROK family protein [Saccharothrix obliqua]
MTTPTAGARPDEVRRHNRTALLRRLHVTGPATRAALATELGLNRSTIKALVDGLAETGVVAERVPALRSGAGRPSLLVLPQPQAAVVVAVDVRVEQVAMAFVGLGGHILGRDSWNLHHRSREPAEVITHIADSVRLLADELDVTAVGVGVSVPGVVRRSDGLVHEAPNLHWTDVALGRRLSAVLKAPVRVGNDAELGALAEHVRGAARGSDDVVYVSADVGVGGGVISSGAPLRGSGGYVGELGHMVVRPGGRPCYCGSRGCWETEVGEAALCRALGLPEDVPRGAIVAELRSASPEALADRLAGFTEWLALGLVTAVNVLGPELVVLGDLFTALPEQVVDEVRRVVRHRSLVSRAVGGTRVVRSPLGRDAKLIGAAELAFEPVLDEV